MDSHTSPIKVVSVTPQIERHIAYCARVSNPQNQNNQNVVGLIKYCINNKHWSIFEHGFLTLEINTSRAISAQLIRHRSFTFQEFSQRYSSKNLLGSKIHIPDLRRQDTKNRQNSTDDLSEDIKDKYKAEIETLFAHTTRLYDNMLKDGIAKECARFILPMCAPTRVIMSGNIRSWIHYLQLRTGNGTQKEHKELALQIKDIFMLQFPVISKSLGWVSHSDKKDLDELEKLAKLLV